MKKIFGGINLTWKKVIIAAILIGIYVGGINSIHFFHNTSFTDIAIYFEWWILFGIIIIMNSKSNLDSALKCFVFFLISQPLIYLVEVPFSTLGWQLFVYYKFWFIWTILCLPMGYIGYYLKKDKWWGLLILLPIMGLISLSIYTYFGEVLFSFPRHLLSCLFCVCSLIIYPLAIFNNKKIKITGLIIDLLAIIILLILSFNNKFIYETEVLCSGNNYTFDNTYSVYLTDSKYGEVIIKEIPNIETYCVHSVFKKAGNTELVLESPDGNKISFNLKIEDRTYKIEEKK